MRPLTETALADLAAHGGDKWAVVLFHLTNPHGLRVFARTIPPDALIGQSGNVYFADGSQVADGSILAGAGSEVLLGIHNWVIDGGKFTEGARLGASPLDAFREVELSAFNLILANPVDADGARGMSRILAQEPVTGARLDVRVGFKGQISSDVLPLASFVVRGEVEGKTEVTLECEGI